MQKLQLSIPEPCHENWQQMTPTDQGRFCNACAKEVIDFSMMTDTEVLNYFTSLTHDKVCGRALPSQLERTISRPTDPKKRLFWYWNYMVMFFMFFGKGNGVKAQGGIKKITCMQTVTGADIDIIKSTNVNNALAGKIAGPAISRIITGKVVDVNGNPVSFASIKVKNKPTDISADANGEYSIKANSNAILVISGASFKEAEVVVGSQSFINTVMKKDPNYNLKEVVVTMAICTRRRPVSEDNKIVNTKPVVIFKVKDDNTDLVIENAVITITRNNDIKSDTAINQKKGNYEFTKINEGSSYLIKVEAEIYKSNEFTIDASDFKDGKKEWEVLLKRENSAFSRRITPAIQNLKGEFQVNVMGQTRIVLVNTDSLYVIDGTMTTKAKADNLSPDDIEDIIRLEKSEALRVFGIEAANGAIVITTRKAKEIKMKEVVVNSEYGTRRTTRGGICYTNTYKNSFLGDTLATVKTLLADSIKIYPNPVPRNTAFSVALKLKQAENYSLQVTDASGRILLLQKYNAGSKDHTEKIMSDSRWAAGVYYIWVFDAQNKLVNKSSFIVQ